MLVVLVLVAHNGRTLQLGSVQPSTRVDAVQDVLEELTGVPVSEQIVMCRGARLDPSKSLAAYQLPADNQTSAEDNPVFLYSKAFIRPGASLPPWEQAETLEVNVPVIGSISVEHPLHKASSPLLRALPDYEMQFQHHEVMGQEYWEVSQKYFKKCHQLLSEQEVQSRAIDAARANIQVHFNYISTVFTKFMEQYNKQHSAHSEVLGAFERDMDVLASTELHPRLQDDKWTRLIDLVPDTQLREWKQSCKRAHHQFAVKVSELETLFTALKQDVEALFMQAPTVDLDDLGALLEEKEHVLEEQGSIFQVLSKDLKTVRALVEETVELMGADRLNSSTIHDTCGAMESMHESHDSLLVPQLKKCTTSLEEFCSHCVTCKNRMTVDILTQLQAVSALQSKIRDMKNKLAAFREVAAKQEEAFAELLLVRRIPAGYRACLSECVRRKAWMEMYSGQAVRLAEHMGKIRSKEASKREAFQKEVECFFPQDLLHRMGLLERPPHCQISIPDSEESLLSVSVDELKRIPRHPPGASATTSTPSTASSSVQPQISRQPSVSQGSVVSDGEGDMSDAASHAHTLEMENAKLRADFAGQVAFQHLRELELSGKRVFAVERGEEGGGRSTGGGGAEQDVDVDVGLRKLQEALDAQKALNGHMEARLADTQQLNRNYEDRIMQLEEKLKEMGQLGSLSMEASSAQQAERDEAVVKMYITVSEQPPCVLDTPSLVPRPLSLSAGGRSSRNNLLDSVKSDPGVQESSQTREQLQSGIQQEASEALEQSLGEKTETGEGVEQ